MAKRCEVCGSTSATVLTCKIHGIKDCAKCHQRMNRRLSALNAMVAALPNRAVEAYIRATQED